MGEQVIWDERFNTGVESIDREHEKLFGIINKMIRFGEQPEKHQWICDEGIKFFKAHALKHFKDEEEYMTSIGYEGYKTHKRLHDDFRQITLPQLEWELEHTRYSVAAVNHFLGVCTGWLIGHTLTEDLAIVGGGESKWGDLLPEEEQASMGEAIVHLLEDMFRLKAHVISKQYGGEKFGNGIYYRLVYETEGNKEWEIVLVFEERLLLNTVGRMIDTKTDRVNSMIINATRYTAKQFVEKLKRYFPSADLRKAKGENLLNYEQFQQAIEKKNMQFSLLFDTGVGYFAFCVSAPHLLAKGVGTNIKVENAVSEIEKYLEKTIQENEDMLRKKVLVVDDSNLMREAIRQLLDKDYEVSLAQSGMAAIRSITLNRPDLVLLDYEMPVCDGKQVLDMIRAEEETADIPVMFLTGRGDKESIQKIVPLKPAGYLLKTMKPEEIKKNIDDYFKITECLTNRR